MKLFSQIIIISFSYFLISCQSYKYTYVVGTLTPEDAKEYQLDPNFYKKVTKVQNILIATSKTVSDNTHRETAYLFDMMMKRVKPEIAQRVRDQAILCILVAHNELTSDIPHFKTKKTGKDLDFYNWRSRGFLTKKNKRFTVFFAEEDVLEYNGGSHNESILIHEFGHVIHKAGFDKVYEDRLKATYKNAMDKGLWRDGRAAQRFRRIESNDVPVSVLDALVKSFPKVPKNLLVKCLDHGDITINDKKVNAQAKAIKKDDIFIVFGGEKACYATVNRAEYFAEGFQIWYDTNRTMDHDHNHITTRKQLIEYDPMLAKLCEDIQGNSAWRFVSPRQRGGQDHLIDFDPAESPTKVSPDFIRVAALDYYDKYWEKYWERLAKKHNINLK